MRITRAHVSCQSAKLFEQSLGSVSIRFHDGYSLLIGSGFRRSRRPMFGAGQTEAAGSLKPFTVRCIRVRRLRSFKCAISCPLRELFPRWVEGIRRQIEPHDVLPQPGIATTTLVAAAGRVKRIVDGSDRLL